MLLLHLHYLAVLLVDEVFEGAHLRDKRRFLLSVPLVELLGCLVGLLKLKVGLVDLLAQLTVFFLKFKDALVLLE